MTEAGRRLQNAAGRCAVPNHPTSSPGRPASEPPDKGMGFRVWGGDDLEDAGLLS